MKMYGGVDVNVQGVEVRVPEGSRIFSPPCRPEQLWGPPNFLSNEWGEGLFP
jgi:hypothetical protein